MIICKKMKRPSESKLIICSIVRNAEEGLKHNIPVIKKLVSLFADYRIIVYENDSVDKTKELLEMWMEEDREHVCALINNTDGSRTIPTNGECGGANPFFSKKRISKMADARNHYMQYVDSIDGEYDYMMVVDLDVAQLYCDNIMTSFADDAPDWDVVTAYGYSRSPMMKMRYHDTYAMVEYGEEDLPQTEDTIYKVATFMAKEMRIKKWKRVFSAFGGLAIYRFELVRGLRYGVLPNNDSRVEVRCEHYSIYHQMVRRKPNLKVYINSQMKIHYQKVTLELIWNTIKRMFNGWHING